MYVELTNSALTFYEHEADRTAYMTLMLRKVKVIARGIHSQLPARASA